MRKCSSMMSIVFDEVVTTLGVMVIVLGAGCYISIASRRASPSSIDQSQIK